MGMLWSFVLFWSFIGNRSSVDLEFFPIDGKSSKKVVTSTSLFFRLCQKLHSNNEGKQQNQQKLFLYSLNLIRRNHLTTTLLPFSPQKQNQKVTQKLLLVQFPLFLWKWAGMTYTLQAPWSCRCEGSSRRNYYLWGWCYLLEMFIPQVLGKKEDTSEETQNMVSSFTTVWIGILFQISFAFWHSNGSWLDSSMS